jgi:hypothetical protein
MTFATHVGTANMVSLCLSSRRTIVECETPVAAHFCQRSGSYRTKRYEPYFDLITANVLPPGARRRSKELNESWLTQLVRYSHSSISFISKLPQQACRSAKLVSLPLSLSSKSYLPYPCSCLSFFDVFGTMISVSKGALIQRASTNRERSGGRFLYGRSNSHTLMYLALFVPLLGLLPFFLPCSLAGLSKNSMDGTRIIPVRRQRRLPRRY